MLMKLVGEGDELDGRGSKSLNMCYISWYTGGAKV